MKHIALTFFILTLTVAAPPVRANEPAFYIELLGRQNALGHRMARAMCFAQLGIEKDNNLQIIKDSRDEIDAVLAGLLNGDAARGIEAITDGNMRTRLDTISMMWGGLRGAADKVLEGETLTERDLKKIGIKTDSIGKLWQAVSSGMELYTSLFSTSDELNRARMLGLSVNQPHLLQKAGKTACLLQLETTDTPSERMVTQLHDATAAFFDGAFNLTFGSVDTSLPPPPTAEIQSGAFEVWMKWAGLESHFESLAEGHATDATLRELSYSIEFLHQMIDETTPLYVAG